MERLRSQFSEEECSVVENSHQWSTLVVSNSVFTVASRLPDGGYRASIFGGYAVDYSGGFIAFPNADESYLPDPGAPVDGCYFRAISTPDGFECGGDSLHYGSLLWTTGDGFFAVSDSLMVLVHLRSVLSESITIDEETVRGRDWTNSMGCAQMGHETICKEVEFATMGSRLYYKATSEVPVVEYGQLTWLLPSDGSTHGSEVRKAGIRMASLVGALASSGEHSVLALSGGLDSRLCLAAAIRSGSLEGLNVRCQKNSTNDYAVAGRLADQFGFDLNPTLGDMQGTLEEMDLFASWAVTSLGLYDQLYVPKHFRRIDAASFSLGGQGAEAAKGNFRWRKLSTIAMPAPALDQAERAVERLGIDRNDKWGSEWQYLAFRNGLHANRSLVSSDYCVRPTAQLPLIGLSRSDIHELDNQNSKIQSVISDTLIALSPDLAAVDFDNHAKNLSSDTIDSRLAALGGPIESSEITPLSIVGNPAPSLGVTRSFIDIARSYGIFGNMDGSTVDRIVSGLDSDMWRQTKVGGELWDQIRIDKRARIPATSREGAGVGKIVGWSWVESLSA